MKIYHNPRCGKSRETLQLIRDHNIEPEVVLYLNQPLSHIELKELLQAMGITPFDLVRKSEKIYLQQFKGKDLSEEEWIDAMVQNPILIQRPIVISGNKSIIGRPPTNVLSLI